jgi:hypothetical protein
MNPNEKILRLRKHIEGLRQQIEHLEQKEAHDRFWLIVTAFLALTSLWKTVIQQWLP